MKPIIKKIWKYNIAMIIILVIVLVCNITTHDNKVENNITKVVKIEEPEVIEKVIEEEVVEEAIEEIVEEQDDDYIIEVSDAEYMELAKIIMAEAQGESLDGKILVGNVILNRVASDKFPDDIISVIRQKNQFTPVMTGKINKIIPSDECYEAVEMLLRGYDISQGALYFESCKGESWHSRNLEFIFEYGGHRFYK